ncbi:MAG: DAK2 domain-containing protein [Lachnospiraceae bacterium]|nr:DAK2 domain-containing protein [Lachnospiraceae bacterium]
MAIKTIDSELLVKMFLAGAANLEAHKEIINDLNVFPVPDGDTGTNMSMTVMAAVKAICDLENPDMESVAKAISSGSLRGARGNSGVILSQLFRGFTKVVREEKIMDAQVLVKACERGVATAYKAVMKPKEGTILTVAKGIAKKTAEMAETTDDLEIVIPAVLKYGKEVLDRTPDMLPVLKEAGVVDSGGQGLLEILNGAYDVFLGKEVDYDTVRISNKTKVADIVIPDNHESIEITFGYCTEFLILLEKEITEDTEDKFKAFLDSIGDSVVCVADEEVIKVHVHTDDPGLALQKALTFGQLSNIKIDNMREEHEEKLMRDASKKAAKAESKIAPKEEEAKKEDVRKAVGFIAVSIGEGINDIFRDLGVDHLIEGGQTMNPSTDDMLMGIDAVNADHIFILPNNKNIILAANQAQTLTKDKDIIVVPTTTVPQGIAALISFMEEEEVDVNIENMKEIIQNVKTGQVTYAVRDTQINSFVIKEGDIMGISDNGICAVNESVAEATLDMLKEQVTDDSEMISIFYGSDVKEEEANALKSEVEKLFPHVDIDIHFGGQPIYYYLTSVE